MNKGVYEKVEFEIPKKWRLTFNKLLKVNPSQINNYDESIWNEFSEDIINIVNHESNITLDIGWYPQFDRNGYYGLVLIEDNKWNKPVETLVTRDTKELIDKINIILNKY